MQHPGAAAYSEHPSANTNKATTAQTVVGEAVRESMCCGDRAPPEYGWGA